MCGEDREEYSIIKYIPLQQGLRLHSFILFFIYRFIIKYIPLQQGLRPQKQLFSILINYY